MDILVADAIDQIRGQHDDGTTDGIQLVKTLHEGLVRLPIRSPQATEWLSSLNGSAVAGFQPVAYNPDGSGFGISMTAPAVTAGNAQSSVIEQTLYGRRIGVRFRRSGATSTPFTVVVDGAPYSVRNYQQRRHAATTVTSTDYEALFLIADDLGPGPHTVRVHVAGAPIGGSSRNVIFLGWIVDRAAGYDIKPKTAFVPQTAVALTNSAVTIATSTPSQIIRGLFVSNTDTATRVVTVQLNSVTIIKRSILAGATDFIDFELPLQANSALNLKALADAGAVVNMWPLEINA